VEQLQNLIDPVSSFLWGWLLIYVLLATGLYFSIGHAWSSSAASDICGAWCFHRGAARRVASPFPGLLHRARLARWNRDHRPCRNSLTLGGPGAIFWMWCVVLLGMATAFAVATLA
jgi:AGCS family alanine or glycine:cation symporter